MPARTRARRLPFGMGTLTLILSLAMVVAAGMVLIGGGEPTPSAGYVDGALRGYNSSPAVAWEQSSDTLPGYESNQPMRVADTHGEQWLLAYPRGIGEAYQLVDKRSGIPQWDEPIVTGLGGCAFNDAGTVGCAVSLADLEDGFYLVDNEGTPQRADELADTAEVVGVGTNFLRINQPGYHVAMYTPSGNQVWSRTFAARAHAQMQGGQLLITTVDGNQFIVDPTSGEDQISCRQCDIRVYPRGVTVQYDERDNARVLTYPIKYGRLDTEHNAEATSMRVLAGAATLPVLTGVGDEAFLATGGRYEIRDPAEGSALWQIGDAELSKVHAKPCGELVSFAQLDGSRTTFRLDDGSRVGEMAPADPAAPNLNIDTLGCVGSSDSTMVFANNNQLTAFDMASGSLRWELPISGAVQVIDGYIVLIQGTSMSVLRPN